MLFSRIATSDVWYKKGRSKRTDKKKWDECMLRGGAYVRYNKKGKPRCRVEFDTRHERVKGGQKTQKWQTDPYAMGEGASCVELATTQCY